jgi:hypothetical protein
LEDDMKIQMLAALGCAALSVACGGGSVVGPEALVPTAPAMAAAADSNVETQSRCDKLIASVSIDLQTLGKTQVQAQAAYFTEKGEPITDCKGPAWSVKGAELIPQRNPFMITISAKGGDAFGVSATAPNGVSASLEARF